MKIGGYSLKSKTLEYFLLMREAKICLVGSVCMCFANISYQLEKLSKFGTSSREGF